MTKPTVFGIPAPWSGDPGSGTGKRAHPHLYAVWFRLFRTARVVRHAFGLHDWDPRGVRMRCDWCGQHKATP